MGLLKDSLIENTRFDFLLSMDFEYGKRSGPRDENGYTRIFDNNSECLWVTVSPKDNKVYLYNEYNCGGMLWDRTIDIPEEMLNASKQDFIDWLDNEIG